MSILSQMKWRKPVRQASRRIGADKIDLDFSEEPMRFTLTKPDHTGAIVALTISGLLSAVLLSKKGRR